MDSLIDVCKKMWERKPVRFFFVGSFNFVLDVAILNILVIAFKFPSLLANTVSVSIGITASYFLNHTIVFRHKEKHSLKSYLKFFAVSGFSAIILQDFIIDFVAPRLVHVQESDIVTILGHQLSAVTVRVNCAKVFAVLIGMFWNFLLYKYVVFRSKKDSDPEEELIIV